MCDVDRYVDVLYSLALQKFRIPSVLTQWHRYAADLNRIPEDVDAASVVGHANHAGLHNRGFHWQMTTHQHRLMKKPISQKAHEDLVKLIYEPFHHEVQKQYRLFKEQGFQKVYHLDCHSMPSVGTSEHRDPGEKRADIVVSDCLLYTSPSPRDRTRSRMPSSA